jgi:hypothetical protein
MLDMSKKAKEYNQKNWKKKGAWSLRSLRTCLDVSCEQMCTIYYQGGGGSFFIIIYFGKEVQFTLYGVYGSLLGVLFPFTYKSRS